MPVPLHRNNGNMSASVLSDDFLTEDSPPDSASDHGSSHIREVVRVRPLSDLESTRSDAKSIICADDSQTLHVQYEDGRSKQLRFNQAWGEDASQEAVFEECGVKDLVVQAVKGYNATIFAFGQTGSGKTHTITGPPEQSPDSDVEETTSFSP
ncbi:Kinesin- protein 12, partial [Blyttiomyces sp. JEL0837]